MTTDRLRVAVEAIIEALFPQRYALKWRYVVVSATPPVAPGIPPTISARAVNPIMPDLASIDLWADASGSVSVPSVGTTVVVGFLEANGTLPYVDGLGLYGGASTCPTSVFVGMDPTAPAAARVGDAVSVGKLQVTVPPGGGTVPVVVGGPGPEVTGTITAGSSVTVIR
jgi:hypothetical protein